MTKLQLVLENVRDRHMINILEEGTTELVALKTKKFLNENLSIIHKILVEEGVVDGARNHLANNWGKYAAGAALGGAALGAATVNGADGTDAVDTFNNGTGNFQTNAMDAAKAAGQNVGHNVGLAGDAISSQYEAAKAGAQDLATQAGVKLDAAGNKIGEIADNISTGAKNAVTSVGNTWDGLSPAEQNAIIAGGGALGGSALGAGAMYAANRSQQK